MKRLNLLRLLKKYTEYKRSYVKQIKFYPQSLDLSKYKENRLRSPVGSRPSHANSDMEFGMNLTHIQF